MCTAINSGAVFGRTLDLDRSYRESALVIPRAYPMSFLRAEGCEKHAAILATACMHGARPLLYDGMNEHGLAVAALNFPRLAHYEKPREDALCLASFEVIPYLLARCKTLAAALSRLRDAVITDDAVDPALPPSPLHFLIADRSGAAVLEATAAGISLTLLDCGVLTNAPEIGEQKKNLAAARAALREKAGMREGKRVIAPFPGDASSESRFVRASIASEYTLRTEGANEVSRFFHVIGTVAQPLGFSFSEEGKPVRTVYTVAYERDSLSYSFTTYENRRIRTLSLASLAREGFPLDGTTLYLSPHAGGEDVDRITPKPLSRAD